ncbi:MAG: hypothetical protein QM764_20600 [Chitinophagaceae bacterium]
MRTTINLRQTLHQLINRYESIAEQHKNYFISQDLSTLYVSCEEEILSTLLNSLFYLSARCNRNSSITVSAVSYNDMAGISLLSNYSGNAQAILYGFQHFDLLANEIDGHLDISSYRNRESVVSFTFKNYKTAMPFTPAGRKAA